VCSCTVRYCLTWKKSSKQPTFSVADRDRRRREITRGGSQPRGIATQLTIQTIDALFDRPIFETTDFIERSSIPRASALRILRALQEASVLAVVRESSGLAEGRGLANAR
jgi:hypothetical protein